MAGKVTENWEDEPDDHDYPAAEDYLSLLMAATAAKRLVGRFRTAPIAHRKAKDLLRASQLRVLPTETSTWPRTSRRSMRERSFLQCCWFGVGSERPRFR